MAFLQTKLWHWIVGVAFPALYVALDAGYTLVQNGTIHVNMTGLGGAVVTGIGFVLAAAASHVDDTRVNPAGVTLPQPPTAATTDLTSQLSQLRSAATEIVQLRDLFVQFPGGQQAVAALPPEVVTLLGDIRTALTNLPAAAPLTVPPQVAAAAGTVTP